MNIIRLKGGLGNQMFQYAAGLLVAGANGEPIYIDTDSYRSDSFGRSFGLDAFRVRYRRLSSFRKYQLRFATLATKRVPWFQSFCPEVIVDDESGLRKPRKSRAISTLDGYWQSYLFYTDIEASLRQDFSLKSPPPANVADLARQIVETPNATMMHIRRTDYALNPEVAGIYGGSCPLAYYQRATAALRLSGIEPTIFVFSDDPEWVSRNFHIDMPFTPVSLSPARWEVHDELHLMASCQHFVIANSTFSWWAAWLGSRSGKRIFAPLKWYSGRSEPHGLIPSHWQRI